MSSKSPQPKYKTIKMISEKKSRADKKYCKNKPTSNKMYLLKHEQWGLGSGAFKGVSTYYYLYKSIKDCEKAKKEIELEREYKIYENPKEINREYSIEWEEVKFGEEIIYTYEY